MVIMGTAGCGKSTLTSALESRMKDYDLDVITINLDPAARRLPYTPDVDARDYVSVDDLMNQLGLGPNGALIAAVDMVAGQVDKIKEEIEGFKTEYAIIDTPGQIELFAYRTTGPLIISALEGTTVSNLHLFDPNLCRHPSGFVSLSLLDLSLQFRFVAAQLALLSKCDMLSREEIDHVVEWSTDSVKLYDEIDSTGTGPTQNTSKMICEMLERIGSRNEIIPVSSETGEGLDQLYAELERIWVQEPR
jgi:GTPase SAR1 family protein